MGLCLGQYCVASQCCTYARMGTLIAKLSNQLMVTKSSTEAAAEASYSADCCRWRFSGSMALAESCGTISRQYVCSSYAEVWNTYSMSDRTQHRNQWI